MVAKGHRTLSLTLLYSLAGPAGFEPANAGTKTRCLTTWRRPNSRCRRQSPTAAATGTDCNISAAQRPEKASIYLRHVPSISTIKA